MLASPYIARGLLNPSIALRIGTSNVPNAGRGVFADADLPAATVLGAYPGMLRTPADYEQKRLAAPAASSYCWVLDDSSALDPTDEQGVLLEPLPRLAFGKALTLGAVSTTLALINEPALGMDVNVVTAQSGSILTFSTGRDIARGEELFLDYGPLYDRSAYGGGSS